MKKFILSFVLFCSFTLNGSAQKIYNEVKRIMHEMETIKYDTSKDLEERKIATFKWDAIYYMIMKAAQDSTFSEVDLGNQTYAMLEFVNIYVKRLTDIKKQSERNILREKFKSATIGNALFNDNEKEIVDAYLNNDKFLTQFSLDCNWVRALEAVRK